MVTLSRSILVYFYGLVFLVILLRYKDTCTNGLTWKRDWTDKLWII